MLYPLLFGTRLAGRTAPAAVRASPSCSAALGGEPARECCFPGGLCPEGVEGEGPWGGEDAHFPLCALYPRSEVPQVLWFGAAMCGLVSERAPHRARRMPTSSPGPDLAFSWPKAWGSDWALQNALGVSGPRPSPPGFEDAFPQVFRSLYLLRGLGVCNEPPGALCFRMPPGRRAAPAGWVRTGAVGPVGTRRSAPRLRSVRSSGVSY